MSSVPSRRKKPSIISRWYLYWYQRNYQLWVLVGALTGLVLALSKLIDLLGNFTLQVAIITSLIGGFISIAFRIYKMGKEFANNRISVQSHDSNSFERFLETVALPKELEESGYVIVRGGFGKGIFTGDRFQGASATSEDINQVLWNRSTEPGLPLRVSVPLAHRWRIFGYPKRWTRPQITTDVLKGVWNERLKRGWNKRAFSFDKLANEKKIRLSQDLLLPFEEKELSIECTDYLSDLVTGQVTGVTVQDSGRHEIYNGYSFAYKWDDGKWRLKLCSESDCSNQIGASALALGVSHRNEAGSKALQGHVFIVAQGGGNIQSPGLLAPSGSGSLDWSDYTDFGNQFIVRGMEREMLEETWAGSWEDLTARGRMQSVVTGFGRMLHRGGKPEFYGLVVMPRGGHEFGIDKTERAYVDDVERIEVFPLSASTLRVKLEDFVRENQTHLSHPLYLCINLLLAYLVRQPNRFEEIVKDVGDSAR